MPLNAKFRKSTKMLQKIDLAKANFIGRLEDSKKEGFCALQTSEMKRTAGAYFQGEIDPSKPYLRISKEECLVFAQLDKGGSDDDGSYKGIVVNGAYLQKGIFIDHKLHGFGEENFADLIRMGEFKNGLLNGFACLIDNQNSITYKGNFLDGVLKSPANIETNENDYFGEVQEFQITGLGILKNTKEDYIITGNFKNGQPHGFCVLDTPDGSQYQGFFDEGKKSGISMACYMKDGEEVFILGTSINGKLNGLGTETYRGFSYIGEFSNGLKSGKGLFTREGFNGYYFGQFKNDKRSGVGVLNTGKLIYKGQFKNDKYHGIAEVISNNERRYEVYENGRKIMEGGLSKSDIKKLFDFDPKGAKEYRENSQRILAGYRDTIRLESEKLSKIKAFDRESFNKDVIKLSMNLEILRTDLKMMESDFKESCENFEKEAESSNIETFDWLKQAKNPIKYSENVFNSLQNQESEQIDLSFLHKSTLEFPNPIYIDEELYNSVEDYADYEIKSISLLSLNIEEMGELEDQIFFDELAINLGYMVWSTFKVTTDLRLQNWENLLKDPASRLESPILTPCSVMSMSSSDSCPTPAKSYHELVEQLSLNTSSASQTPRQPSYSDRIARPTMIDGKSFLEALDKIDIHNLIIDKVQEEEDLTTGGQKNSDIEEFIRQIVVSQIGEALQQGDPLKKEESIQLKEIAKQSEVQQQNQEIEIVHKLVPGLEDGQSNVNLGSQNINHITQSNERIKPSHHVAEERKLLLKEKGLVNGHRVYKVPVDLLSEYDSDLFQCSPPRACKQPIKTNYLTAHITESDNLNTSKSGASLTKKPRSKKTSTRSKKTREALQVAEVPRRRAGLSRLKKMMRIPYSEREVMHMRNQDLGNSTIINRQTKRKKK